MSDAKVSLIPRPLRVTKKQLKRLPLALLDEKQLDSTPARSPRRRGRTSARGSLCPRAPDPALAPASRNEIPPLRGRNAPLLRLGDPVRGRYGQRLHTTRMTAALQLQHRAPGRRLTVYAMTATSKVRTFSALLHRHIHLRLELQLLRRDWET